MESASDGATAHYLGDVEDFDAVVLDLGLPALDGLSVLRRWRAAGRTMPVLILTARSAWHEKVAGIDAGADDYLAKPFHMEELLARLRALLRRRGEHASAQWQCGAILLDTRQARVLVDGLPLQLTEKALKLNQEIDLKAVENGLATYLDDYAARRLGEGGWKQRLDKLDRDDLAIVAWVQDNDSKQVLQAFYQDVPAASAAR